MKRLLLWFANRRRADILDDESLTWRLTKHLSLMVLTHSDDRNDQRPLDHTAIWLSLVGVYVACGKDYVRAPAVRRWKSTQPLNVLLADADAYEDRLLTLAWMEKNEMRFDTDRQVWLLVWA
jgi:hypothetical protein